MAKDLPAGAFVFHKNELFGEHISMYCRLLIVIVGFKSGRNSQQEKCLYVYPGPLINMGNMLNKMLVKMNFPIR